MAEYTDREALLNRMEKRLADLRTEYGNYDHYTDGFEEGCVAVEDAEAVDVVEVDKVAEMLYELFGDDDCPCNYVGIDEWLPEVCELQDECPNPKEKLGCWKQFIKHYGERKEQ